LRLRQENVNLEALLDYIPTPVLEKKKRHLTLPEILLHVKVRKEIK
jgi:hypothetical protein